jgi:hypothetical protein
MHKIEEPSDNRTCFIKQEDEEYKYFLSEKPLFKEIRFSFLIGTFATLLFRDKNLILICEQMLEKLNKSIMKKDYEKTH